VFAGAAPVVAVVGIITMLSALNAYMVGASRVLQNLAAAYRLQPLAALSARGTPVASLGVVCGLSTGLLLFWNRFDTLASASVIANLVPYVAICWVACVRSKAGAARVVAAVGGVLTAAILVLYLLS
jgi:amino acid transporter